MGMRPNKQINLTRVITLLPKSNLEEFAWSHQSITGLISQRQFGPQCQFLASSTLACCSSRLPDKSHNFTNLIFITLSLQNSVQDTTTHTRLFTFYRVLTSSASMSSPNSSSTFLSTAGVVGVVGTAVAGDVGVNGGRYKETFKALPLNVLPLLKA